MIKYLALILILLLAGLKSGNCQTFVSDSIVYHYNGEVSPEREKSFLRQFGLKDTVTNETEVIRNGDFIQTRTRLDPEGTKVRLLTITIDKRLDPIEKVASNNKYTEQTLTGIADLGIYHNPSQYYSPIPTSGSNYVTVIWREFDLDKDGVVDHLQFNFLNWMDIWESIYCHLK